MCMILCNNINTNNLIIVVVINNKIIINKLVQFNISTIFENR